MRAQMYARIHRNVQVFQLVCVQACLQVCMPLSMQVCKHIWQKVRTHLCAHACKHSCLHSYMLAFVLAFGHKKLQNCQRNIDAKPLREAATENRLLTVVIMNRRCENDEIRRVQSSHPRSLRFAIFGEIVARTIAQDRHKPSFARAMRVAVGPIVTRPPSFSSLNFSYLASAKPCDSRHD